MKVSSALCCISTLSLTVKTSKGPIHKAQSSEILTLLSSGLRTIEIQWSCLCTTLVILFKYVYTLQIAHSKEYIIFLHSCSKVLSFSSENICLIRAINISNTDCTSYLFNVQNSNINTRHLILCNKASTLQVLCEHANGSMTSLLA